MKLIKHFDAFLSETVNLNDARIGLLEDRCEAISTFMSNSDYGATIRRFSPQGSWSHKTIIKPPTDKGFDADLLMFVWPKKGWTAADYVNDAVRVLKSSDRYKALSSPETRCALIEYAGEFSVDLVPCVVDRYGAGFEVCNRKVNTFEPTAPEAYTAWITERNSWTGGNRIRKVTRLLKYLRDIKGTFTAKSILLTTLVGECVRHEDIDDPNDEFCDTPTALLSTARRLNAWLGERPSMPDVVNPVLPVETFSRHWDDDKYQNFRDKISTYCQWIEEAYFESDRDESISKWRRVFGPEFAKGETIEKAANAGTLVLKQSKLPIDPESDLVEAIRRHGKQLLNYMPMTLPHMHPPIWALGGQVPVSIRAFEGAGRRPNALSPLASGDILARDRAVKFEAVGANGMLFASRDFEVQWQVVNTGHAAIEDEAERGEFYSSDPQGCRWEDTRYRGAHWVQAFLIRKRDQKQMGRSERFFVVVE